MDFDSALAFGYKHQETIIWILGMLFGMLAAYSMGARKVLADIRNNKTLIGFIFDKAYDAVDEYTKDHGKPQNKAVLGVKFVLDTFKRLNIAPPPKVAQDAVEHFTSRHDGSRNPQ